MHDDVFDLDFQDEEQDEEEGQIERQGQEQGRQLGKQAVNRQLLLQGQVQQGRQPPQVDKRGPGVASMMPPPPQQTPQQRQQQQQQQGPRAVGQSQQQIQQQQPALFRAVLPPSRAHASPAMGVGSRAALPGASPYAPSPGTSAAGIRHHFRPPMPTSQPRLSHAAQLPASSSCGGVGGMARPTSSSARPSTSAAGGPSVSSSGRPRPSGSATALLLERVLKQTAALKAKGGSVKVSAGVIAWTSRFTQAGPRVCDQARAISGGSRRRLSNSSSSHSLAAHLFTCC